MKYVCKELWTYLFHQPASRLQADKHGGSLDSLRLLTLDSCRSDWTQIANVTQSVRFQ